MKKYNKSKSYLLALIVMLTLNLEAQTSSSKIFVGFNISQYQRDFGLGVHLISPYFLNSTIALKGGANIQWFENFNGTETTWSDYQNFQLGVRARNTIIPDKIIIYGEGGIITILPNSDFATQNTEFGGYGLFGFEFLFQNAMSYFMEFGGMGTGATADKIADQPIYSNGFLINVGFRIGL